MKKELLTVVAAACLTASAAPRGVLLLSFDDRNFAGWERALPLFAKYDAHATFFVSGAIDGTAVASMRKLAAAGHSVGLHGLRHANADTAIEQVGAEKYYADDIAQPRESVVAAKIPLTSFAYPNCRFSEASDRLFREKGFRHVRGGVKGATPFDPTGEKQKDRRPLVTNEKVFFPVADLAGHFRIDTIIMGEVYHTDIDEILACLERAAAKGEVISITSHDIAPDAKQIHMKTAWLEKILAKAKELGLAVLGFDELEGMPK